jgi:hypothetical protein
MGYSSVVEHLYRMCETPGSIKALLKERGWGKGERERRGKEKRKRKRK